MYLDEEVEFISVETLLHLLYLDSHGEGEEKLVHFK